MTPDEAAAWLRARSGHPVVDAFAFGDSPGLADELLGFIRGGTKRATAGAVAEAVEEAEAGRGPFPAPGMFWGVLDGGGVPRFVIETVEVRTGPLDSVDPAFAWDEGEYDRTLESWLEAHRRFFRRQGVDDPDHLDVLFERFRVVWPTVDTTVWLADGVRELRHDERAWAAAQLTERWGGTRVVGGGAVQDVAGLPAIVAERGGQRAGLLTFRPRPGGDTEIVTTNTAPDDQGIGGPLLQGIAELGRRNGWRRVWSHELELELRLD